MYMVWITPLVTYGMMKIKLTLQAAIYIPSPWAGINRHFRPEMHNRNYTKSMFVTLSLTVAHLCIKSSLSGRDNS